MFEDYIQDAYTFYHLANDKLKSGDQRKAQMFYRASIFCAASAMEAFMNFLGSTLKSGSIMDSFQLAYVNDKTLEFNPSKLNVQEKVKYNAIDEKLKFIIKRFEVPLDVGKSVEWSYYIEFKALRDSLVHSKDLDDEITPAEYKEKLRRGLNSIIDIINVVSETIFERSLRKSVSELKI